MNFQIFFNKSNFREYVRLLGRLHDLIVHGQDEGPEGEKLRDQMDACSRDFSDDEIASLNRISADLYPLTEHAPPPRPKTPQAQQDLFNAMLAERSGDHLAVLGLLRRNRTMIDPSLLSYMRGQVFADAGRGEIANKFFEHASMLEPANAAHG